MNIEQRLSQEWQTLQNNHEQYEKGSLLIKLTCLVAWAGGLAANIAPVWIALLVLLFWLQDGIYKTYQARLAQRLLRVESLIRENPPNAQPMQLHSEWLSQRKRGAGLLLEYALSACRPTVAYPYALLLLLSGVEEFLF